MSNGTSSIPELARSMTLADRLGSLRVRLGIMRSSYAMKPGLYRVGTPEPDAPVFVSANYKLSVDALRSSLDGIDAWILVVDTKGINVWCAAGKGTFSAEAVITQMKRCDLGRYATSRELILPQLSAPGVDANALATASGWKVRFGPVRAEDIPAYLRDGRQASPEMRRVRFGLIDRLVLIPNDLSIGLPFAAAAFALARFVSWILTSLGLSIFPLRAALAVGSIVTASWLSGGVLVPALLPLVPFRRFAAKGAVIGGPVSSVVAFLFGANPWFVAAAGLGGAVLAGKVALDFTGSTVFTGISGVERELREGVRIGAVLLLLALAFIVIGGIA